MRETGRGGVFESGRREAVVVLLIWCVAAAWTLGYCGWYGYGRPSGELRFVLGFPAWVFWGIVAPWSISLGVSAWFSYGFMADEDLGQPPGTVEAEKPDARGSDDA